MQREGRVDRFAQASVQPLLPVDVIDVFVRVHVTATTAQCGSSIGPIPNGHRLTSAKEAGLNRLSFIVRAIRRGTTGTGLTASHSSDIIDRRGQAMPAPRH